MKKELEREVQCEVGVNAELSVERKKESYGKD